ncbi:MAG: hypothetical protein K0R72_712 [Clostridia bacterium]|jgi:predicted XRE-type DNA-binding protein|nr:hypothetical protein [Clostridia bacterium]
MNNLEIRQSIEDNGFKKYQIAHALKIREESFSRKLRNEMTIDEKNKILETIKKLKKEKE